MRRRLRACIQRAAVGVRRAAQPDGRQVLLGGAACLTAVSGYLMVILVTQLDAAPCPYCLTSAALSLSLLVASLQGWAAAEVQAAAPASAAAALAALLLVAVPQAAAQRGGEAAIEIPYAAKTVSARSTAYSRALAAHLRASGAKMYGAFWCSHCADQKEEFGSGADIPYVECFPDGFKTGQPARPRSLLRSCALAAAAALAD